MTAATPGRSIPVPLSSKSTLARLICPAVTWLLIHNYCTNYTQSGTVFYSFQGKLDMGSVTIWFLIIILPPERG